MRAFWEALGSHVEIMSAAHHDLVLAITSHVPHLIAYNIVGTAADLEEVTRSEVIKFSAGGFRDFTRIAASDPTMWRDVFLHNKEAVLEMLGRFNEDLTALQRMIRRGDGDGLFALFTRTRAIRRGIVAQGQETPRRISAGARREADEPASVTCSGAGDAGSDGDLWVFGYGSLMWRPGFAYARRCKALLRGWRRSLCVYSHVYRGIAGAARTRAWPGSRRRLSGGGFRGRRARLREATIRYLREREQVTAVYLERIAPVTLESGDRVPCGDLCRRPAPRPICRAARSRGDARTCARRPRHSLATMRNISLRPTIISGRSGCAIAISNG